MSKVLSLVHVPQMYFDGLWINPETVCCARPQKEQVGSLLPCLESPKAISHCLILKSFESFTCDICNPDKLSIQPEFNHRPKTV